MTKSGIWIANLDNDIIPKTYESLQYVGIEIAEKNIFFKKTVVFLIHETLE